MTKLSAITPATGVPVSTDQVVGVVGGANDRLYTVAQLAAAVGAGTVTQVNTGLGLTGGPITTTGTIAALPASASQFGVVKVDGTTITATGGVISSVGGGASGANPSATASNVAVNGTAATFMRSDAAPAVQLTSASQFGLCKPDGTTITAAGGVLSAAAGGALQIGSTPISGGTSGNFLFNNAGVLGGAAITGGTDPLLLTQGFSLSATDPTLGGDPSFRRAAQIISTVDTLDTIVGFADNAALYVQLNFNAGINLYDPPFGTQAKSTPIALNVGITASGAGEKFCQAWNAQFYSMGDSCLLSAAMTYAGGPISGDEGQCFTPAFFCVQPSNLALGTIQSVARTGYTTTVTSDITASQNVQVLPVASTVGAVVGDWVILNQSVDTGADQIWPMQITAINPGVSISGVCAINLNANTGHGVSPALVMNVDGQGYQFGEQRVLVNTSGASYSVGTLSAASNPLFTGSGTSWSNSMVGGNALNIGAIYLDTDTFTQAPFNSTGASGPLRSYYQITAVNSTTSITIHSFSVAGDVAYHGRGEGNSGLTYKILPAARVLRVNPPTGPWGLVCETSTHVWNVGDVVECAICPFPDVHGFDYRIGEWTAGGVRRYFMSLTNNGARELQYGLIIGASPSSPFGTNAQFDNFAFNAGIQVQNSNTGLVIVDNSNSSFSAAAAIIITRVGSSPTMDTGTQLQWQNWATLGINTPNRGMDFSYSPDGGTLRSIGKFANVDTNQSQLVWDGYLQLVGGGGAAPYLRFGGGNLANSPIDATMDLSFNGALKTLNFISNQPLATPTAVTTFSISKTFAGTGPQNTATSNTTNAGSFPLRLLSSIWTGSAAQNQYVQFLAAPGQGVDHAPISLQVGIWDNVNNNESWPKIPLEIFTGGLVKIGFWDTLHGSDLRVTLDAITNLTAAATVKFPNIGGDLLVASANTTGGGTASLDANCPAVTPGAPYTWLKTLAHDGSVVYIPAWK
jgi:hypothetical protein